MYPLFAKSTIYKKSYGEKMLINLAMQAKAMISEALAKNRNKISQNFNVNYVSLDQAGLGVAAEAGR